MATKTNLINATTTFLLFFLAVHCSGQTTADCSDFDKLRGYPVVAFGEACHGSYSDYEARAEMIECFIRDGDAVNVLIEMPHATGIAIQKYYAGEIDSDSLLREALYYGLQTHSFINFIDRFKGNKHVTFYGFDAQTHQSTLSYLKETIHREHPSIQKTFDPISDSLNHNFAFNYSDSAYMEYMPVIERNMHCLRTLLEQNNLFDSEHYLSIYYPFQVLQQHFKMLEYVKRDMDFEFVLYRDSCMAENISLIREFTKKQCFVIAANAHVMASNESRYPMMGGHLKNTYGNDYFVIASQYYEGALLEVDIIGGKRTILQKKLAPPIKKSLPYKINKILHPENDTLIIVSEAEGKMQRLFKRKILGQDMGTGRGDYKLAGLAYFKPGEFDAVYYFKYVLPSVNIAPEEN